MKTPTPSTPSVFQNRLTVVALSLLFVVLVIHLLQLFAPILQRLLIAVFAGYVLLPIQRELVRRKVPSKLAYVIILALIVTLMFGLGTTAFNSFKNMTPQRLEQYQQKFDLLVERTARVLKAEQTEPASQWLRRTVGSRENFSQHLFPAARGVAGTFLDLSTSALIVFVYLIFLAAEKLTLPKRLQLSFGERRAGHVLEIIRHINDAIMRYIAVKTWVSFVTAVLSLVILVAFGVEFAVLWALLIFAFNFIPYLGSLVAITPPILLSFLQFDSYWQGAIITIWLIGVQAFTGQILEPRLAGKSLNLSPLLILLALSFWGFLWGIIGMILAVPLTVVCKIVLDNIPETKPVGTLMSNMG
jgi:predicted PurR-regulated permease PerM